MGPLRARLRRSTVCSGCAGKEFSRRATKLWGESVRSNSPAHLRFGTRQPACRAGALGIRPLEFHLDAPPPGHTYSEDGGMFSGLLFEKEKLRANSFMKEEHVRI